MWVLDRKGSISSTFYVFFCTKAHFWRHNFVGKLYFGFEIFGVKILYENCEQIRLMKLTEGVHFLKGPIPPTKCGKAQRNKHMYCNKRVIFLIYTLIFICMLKISHAWFVHMYIT